MSPANEVVVDTSAWIDFFAGRPAATVEDALARGLAVLSPLVVAELISGARRPRERASIADLVRDLPVHETPLDHWIRVGELRQRLRARGISVSTPDAHVAQCAIERGALLVSRDRIFERVARATALRLASA
jgi:hypothetical protein